MPVYRKAPGKWLVRIFVRGTPRSWVVQGSRQDAEEWEARQRVKLAVGEAAPRTVPDFWTFCRDYYGPWASLRLRPSWWKKQKYMINELEKHFGETSLRDIDAASIDVYARKRLDDGLGAVSVNNEVRVLKRILSFARKERKLLLEVPAWSPLDEPGSDRVRAWTRAEVERLYAVCAEGGELKGKRVLPDPDLLPMLVCGINAGLRKGEIIALTWEHVDLRRLQLQIWPSAEWRPKSGRPREVPISDALLPWLRVERRTRWVFPTTKRMDAGELGRFAFWPQKRFDVVRAAAGLVGGPHCMRHTFATWFLESTPDLPLLARVMGHSDTAVTRLYGHLLPDHLARARNAVNCAAGVGPAGLEAKRRWK